MIDGLYNSDVLSLAANISHVGRLDAPCGSARKVAKLCGSWVEIDVCIKDGLVTDFAQRLQACALGQAAAAILARSVIGASPADIQTARDGLYAMLKQGEEPPTGRFAKLALLADVANYPARHLSTMLAFDAVLAALENAQT
ncbi:MAG: iron-sulfur cluster assembly scaffold protein [Robiginitomaculum sp.]|nr:MAG: iron-sulfur cluster assembly scaffold protein [Robiginitomaculum sp.]